METCPYKALSVLESLSTSILPYKNCPATASISACCTALQSTSLSSSLHDPSSPIYHTSQATYWRVDNTEFYPSCIVQPRSASDVSIALSTLASANDHTPQCRFAIRAGGHSTLVGGTNVDYGVTVDLSVLNGTTYDEEKRIASIGPGARWKGVYGALAEHGVGVAGGRGGTVGVGGFLVGGGNSRQTDLEGLVGELEPESGLHSSFFTLTFANDAAILKKAVEIQERLIGEVKKVAKSDEWNIKSLYQPLPGFFAEIGRKKGGNVLGLDEGRDYILDLLWLTWDHVDDTALFDWVGKMFMGELDDFAQSAGGDYPYDYLNYAADSQNPLRSYGEENLDFLKTLAKEPDPQGIFQTQLHGGFKVSLA
ncbi:hypothetical protein BDV10DRAFT_184218 [Aspergillus recurvatus]